MPAAPSASRRKRDVALLVAVALTAVSLAVALTALLIGDRRADRAERAAAVRASALEAARERTLALTSYDHRRLDEDFAAVLARATGEFETDYLRTTLTLRKTFEQTRAVAVGEVVGAGLESADVDGDGPPRAVAVLAVDQVITTAGAAPRTERNRLRMALLRRDGQWLVERVERL